MYFIEGIVFRNFDDFHCLIAGPTINIQTDNSTGSPVFAIIAPVAPTNTIQTPVIAPIVIPATTKDRSDDITTRLADPPVLSTVPTTVRSTLPPLSSSKPPKSPSTTVTHSVTTVTSAVKPTATSVTSTAIPVIPSDKTAKKYSTTTTTTVPLSFFDFDGFDLDYEDPYADDYLEAELDNVGEERLTDIDSGSGYLKVGPDDEDVIDVDTPSFTNPPTAPTTPEPTTTTRRPTVHVTVPPTSIAKHSTTTTTESTTIITTSTVAPTTTPRLTTRSTTTTPAPTTTTPATAAPTETVRSTEAITTARRVQPVTGFQIGSPVVLRANQDLASSLFPDPSGTSLLSHFH